MAHPHGSGLNDPRMLAALRLMAESQIQPVQEAPAQAMPHPHGSGLNDAAMLEAMSQAAQNPGQAPGYMAQVKNALNGGELSPDMQARHDLPRCQMGCEKLLNMIPLPGGGVTKRPGLKFVAALASGGMHSRLVPFAYSSGAKLMLLFQGGASWSQLFILDRDGARGAAAGPMLPYAGGELAALSFCQSGRNLYLAHASHPPAKLAWDGSSFSYSVLDFSNKTPVPSISGFAYEGLAELNTFRNQYYRVTAVNDETGEESLPGEETAWYTCTLTASFSAVIGVNPVAGCSEYRIYKKRGGEYGYIGRIIYDWDYAAEHPAEDINPESPNVFHDIGYDPDVSDPPPARQDFFQGAGNYPSVVFLHQQRLGWAATDNDPLTIWMSQTSNYECLASKQPPRDDDGMEATLASTQANRILWAVSDRAGLALGTEGEEWYLTGAGGEGAAVTPNSISFQPQTRYGSQPGIGAERADASLLFVQRSGRIIRDLGYSYQADRYEARDLTLLARHIFSHNPVADWCWQGSPLYILWCVLASGKLAALTYMPDNEVIAWHRHETAGTIRSCAALDDSSGYSRLWLVVDRGSEGVHVEIMDLPIEPDVEDWDSVYAPPWIYEHRDGKAAHTFRARVIPCLPEAGMENGATAMRVKKINSVTCRVINSYPFKCRALDQHGRQSQTLDMPVRAAPSEFMRQADWSCPLGAGFRQGSRLELVCDGAAPLTILGLAVGMDIALEPATQTGA